MITINSPTKETKHQNPHLDVNELMKFMKSIDENSQDPPIRVLTIDGGGLRGYLTCQILEVIEKEAQKYANDPSLKISDLFDLMVGTSTGGLLVMGLGKLGYTVKQCEQLYDRVAQNVFGGKTDSYWGSFNKKLSTAMFYAKSFFPINAEKFNSDTLADEFKQIFETKENETQPNMLDTDSNKPRVAVVTTIIKHEGPAYPFLLRTYKQNKQDYTELPIYPGSCQPKCWEACRATSAAPIYFKPVNIKIKTNNDSNRENYETFTCTDGGINANNPALAAFAEARNLWPDRHIYLFSVGTGYACDPNADDSESESASFEDSTITDIAKTTVNTLFSGKDSANICAMSTFASLDEMKLDFIRFNARIDPDKTEMSDPNLMEYWKKIGQQYVTPSQHSHSQLRFQFIQDMTQFLVRIHRMKKIKKM